MAKENTNSKQGFTIIEVVLVLAIAGLIFLMVFVALPALQRSQRDTQRRNDIARVSTSLTNYQTNHSYSDSKTNLPEATAAVKWQGTDTFSGDNECKTNVACQFVRDYMNSGVAESNEKKNTFEDPSGNPYSLVISPNIGLTGATLVQLESPDGNEKLTYTDGEGSLSSGTKAFESYTVFMVPGGKCDGEKVKVSAKNDYAILYRLEGAGVYCIDNQ